ncbi:unnamed protein product, partial [Staurois parvus]
FAAASPAISSGRCRHPASVFQSLRASGCPGAGTGGKFKYFRNCHFLINELFTDYCFKAFHIHFVPTALSCALPAF